MEGGQLKEIQPSVVVIVEDEFVIRCDLADCFREVGCTVMEAANADNAIALCRAELAVHVLITDIELDGSGSGWDVAEAFRARWRSVPVIYVSGNTNDRARAVSDSLFFNKPYQSSEVIAACQKLTTSNGN